MDGDPLIRSATRKSKNPPSIKSEPDTKIRAIDARNPKDVNREYVIRSHPNYYGSGS